MSRQKYTGFTLVELLIALVVVAILAAIIYVAYSGIQSRVAVSILQKDLSDASKTIKLYQAENGSFPADISQVQLSASEGTSYQYTRDTATNPQSFCLTAIKNSFVQRITSGSSPESGVCVGHQVNGQPITYNMATNPSFETNLNTIANQLVTSSRSTVWATHGNYSIEITPTGASNDTAVAIGGNGGGMRLSLQQGKTYTITARVYLPAPLTGTLAGGSRRIIMFQRTATASYWSISSNSPPNTAGEHQVSLTFTVHSAATEAFVRLYHGGASGSGTVHFDSIMLVEGSSAIPYADGNTSGWTWTGTADNSASYGPY